MKISAKTRLELNPINIDLLAISETWSVAYKPFDNIRNTIEVGDNFTVLVSVDPTNPVFVALNLQKWLHQKAKKTLEPWLTSLANDRKLRVNRIYVKNQVSRWGSCSEKHNINLNRNLLFLPNHLVQYVLHHELTHLVHLNHSEKFWSLLSTIIPDHNKLRTELRQLTHDYTPLWASRWITSIRP